MDLIERKLVSMQERKDKVLEISREIVRNAGKSITLVHARKMGDANRGIVRLRALARKLRSAEQGFEYFSVQAHQEYVEALAFYSVVKEKRLPSLSEMGTSEIPYLLGIMDLVGELKREAIESMRENDPKAADTYYSLMKDIYDSTRAMRFANSLVPEFRRKQDSARIQIENTGTELLSFKAKQRYI
jgi:translin